MRHLLVPKLLIPSLHCPHLEAAQIPPSVHLQRRGGILQREAYCLLPREAARSRRDDDHTATYVVNADNIVLIFCRRLSDKRLWRKRG